MDYDGDALTYSWNFGQGIPLSNLANPNQKFTKAGEYNVVLTVTDKAGNKSTSSTIVKVGNAEPEVKIAVKGNKSFFFDDNKISYAVNVKDKEDGTIGKGITAEDVVVSINYLEGYDKTMLEQGHKSNVSLAVGKRLIDLSDCKSCHFADKKNIGPSYMDVAKKYPTSRANAQMLAEKIIKGGGGVWGEQAMAAHPQISESNAKTIADYILGLKDAKKASLPVESVYEAMAHKDKKAGAYILQATYSDKGNQGASSLTATDMAILRSPKMRAVPFDDSKGIMKYNVEALGGDIVVATEDNGFIAYEDIDLTDITAVLIEAMANNPAVVGGKIEIRKGSPTGILVGEADIPKGNAVPIKVPLSKQPVGMPQKLFFVFKNPKNDGKPLFSVRTIEFLNK